MNQYENGMKESEIFRSGAEPILCFSLSGVEPILFVANQAPANVWFWASLRRSQSKQCLFCKRRCDWRLDM